MSKPIVVMGEGWVACLDCGKYNHIQRETCFNCKTVLHEFCSDCGAKKLVDEECSECREAS